MNILRDFILSTYIIGLSPTFAACLDVPSSSAQSAVEVFLREPKDLLKQPLDSSKLSYSVKDLLTADTKSILPILIEIARTAPSEQKTAIGSGMANATNICLTLEPSSSKAIREAVYRLGDNNLSKAFTTQLELNASDVASGVEIGRPTYSRGIAEKSGESWLKIRGPLDLGNGQLWNPFAPLPIHKVN